MVMTTMPAHQKLIAAVLIAIAVVILVLSLNQLLPRSTPAQAPAGPVTSVAGSGSPALSPSPSAS
jgi:hypothetical protein